MFERLATRVEARARQAAEATRRKVEAAFAQLPDVQIKVEGDSIVIEALGLARRWIDDTRLRFALWAPSTSFAGPPVAGSDRLGDGPLPGTRTGEDLR